MAIRVDLSRGTARIQIFGYVAWDELARAFTTMVEHPDFRPGMHSLWDLRAADVAQFTTDEVSIFSKVVVEHAPARAGARGALVIPAETDHGMSPLLTAVRDTKLPVRIRIFHDLAEAEAWLGSPEEAD
jgi:hypothetical protein